jgi:hypothetical protein
VYESELERIGNVYMLRDEPNHRLHTLTTEAIMATGVVGFRSIENVGKILEVGACEAGYLAIYWGVGYASQQLAASGKSDK